MSSLLPENELQKIKDDLDKDYEELKNLIYMFKPNMFKPSAEDQEPCLPSTYRSVIPRTFIWFRQAPPSCVTRTLSINSEPFYPKSRSSSHCTPLPRKRLPCNWNGHPYSCTNAAHVHPEICKDGLECPNRMTSCPKVHMSGKYSEEYGVFIPQLCSNLTRCELPYCTCSHTKIGTEMCIYDIDKRTSCTKWICSYVHEKHEQHPRKVCKNGRNCLNQRCKYAHCAPCHPKADDIYQNWREKTLIDCKYTTCTKLDCKFGHPQGSHCMSITVVTKVVSIFV